MDASMQRTVGFRRGQVVLVLTGRERGQYFVVAGLDDDRIYLADGRKRSVDKPKRKNPRHVKVLNSLEAILPDGIWSDEMIRGALSAVKEG